ncbi:hypothetical protein C943_03015 [Mariniradius saccharolyticus AK6]|uniref:Stress-response A/B barrel domain-containing protein n=1 Tax=Mariniradius saccharolyticus AK6 TaxID=1239962 RepID=M7Y2Y5_9BACT|nr:Dabb family protein [Mariniradius saccharolyticus]EMS35122.1 hypothetical protein C943_03015 [Mariniradius saccharolyticus AK6]
MKTRYLFVLLLTAACQQAPKEVIKEEKIIEKKIVMDKALRHVVLFKFKDSSPQAEVDKVVEAFMALSDKIDVIQSLEWGTNNSPEGLAQGFTHCFLVTFASEADRDTYLPHPEHKAFVEVLGPHLDKVLVVDYWATK